MSHKPWKTLLSCLRVPGLELVRGTIQTQIGVHDGDGQQIGIRHTDGSEGFGRADGTASRAIA